MFEAVCGMCVAVTFSGNFGNKWQQSKRQVMPKQTIRLFFRRLYVKGGKVRVGCSFAMLPIAKSAQMLPWSRPGLTNLWHAERFPGHAEFTAVPIFFLFLSSDQ